MLLDQQCTKPAQVLQVGIRRFANLDVRAVASHSIRLRTVPVVEAQSSGEIKRKTARLKLVDLKGDWLVKPITVRDYCQGRVVSPNYCWWVAHVRTYFMVTPGDQNLLRMPKSPGNTAANNYSPARDF
jgi:hypothetical protein